MDNLDIYKKHARPPESALKQIRGGRLKGKTDINPQWRIEALTDLFGPVGFGWHYQITDRRVLGEDRGEQCLFVTVAMRVKKGENWSEPIIGTGGSMLVAKESGGLRINDEAEKMAVTDALSVCCKMLGIASDIYRGLWDGSKYQGQDAEQGKTPRPQPDPRNGLLQQIKRLCKDLGVDGPAAREILAAGGLEIETLAKATIEQLTRAADILSKERELRSAPVDTKAK